MDSPEITHSRAWAAAMKALHDPGSSWAAQRAAGMGVFRCRDGSIPSGRALEAAARALKEMADYRPARPASE